ncbi:E3 ubiquitin-protein ligase TRIM39-like isoform X2 [Hemicordylus capensis]|uniref:E3 ubiquitin-protein ligase TRIM39-like isoform X2 n=1 Tax=Hemicordylus capensis TaxID=884348 RepID=UPI00230444D1|nr:E3 ubiquitin-protein ligase TRIM39-like isoform X2 [Hemicordylus capensis]
MATGGRDEELCDEIVCPICLGFSRDLVILDCGHNICPACLTYCWEEFDRGIPCSKCTETVQQRNFQPNRQTAGGRVVKKLQEEERAEGKRRVCEKHQEPLKLFCKDDQITICLVCEKSKEHKDHNIVPEDEAAQEYQEYIKVQQEPLEKERQHLMDRKLAEELRSQECLDIMHTLSRYDKDNMGHAVELFPGLEEILDIYSEKNSALGDAMGKFKESLESLEPALYKENITLDPDTAHPELILSEDLKSVRKGDTEQDLPNSPKRFDFRPCVLGRERFTSGKHWWEVEVENENEEGAMWAVGVAAESVRRKGKFTFKLNPNERIWAVGMIADEFMAFTSEWTPLAFKHDIRKIRVSLDYEEGCVEFFDADTDDQIFTFTLSLFSGERILPYFWVGYKSRLKC